MSDTFDYADAQATATALLTEFGQAVLIRRVSNTGGTAWEPTQATTDYPSIGVVLNLPRWYPSFTQGDVLRTDRLGYVAAAPLDALGVVPTPFDRFVDAAGRSWKIIDVKNLYPAGINVLYTLQLRI